MSFGSPAGDYIEKSLDLNQYLVPHKAATYFLKVSGDAMKNAGIEVEVFNNSHLI